MVNSVDAAKNVQDGLEKPGEAKTTKSPVDQPQSAALQAQPAQPVSNFVGNPFGRTRNIPFGRAGRRRSICVMQLPTIPEDDQND